MAMAQVCVRHLAKLGMSDFNYSIWESMELSLEQWVGAEEMARILVSRPHDASFLGDVYARVPIADFDSNAKT
ncbi:MAG: hypothetical protein ACOYOU_17230 [Kiritimatiellia bacterium]